MNRPLAAASLALAFSSGCLAYNDSCQPLVEDPEAVIGYLGEDIRLDKSSVRHDNNAIGQLAADALLHAEDESSAPAVLGVINGGGLRAEGLCVSHAVAPKGPMAQGLLYEILLFQNPVATVDLSEQQLVAMMEHSVENLLPAGQPVVAVPGYLLHVSEGTTVQVDCERPKGQRIVSMKVGNTQVQIPARSGNTVRYRVAMTTYLLDGGDGYGGIFGDAGTDATRNPVRARKLGGTDTGITAGYMKARYPDEANALRTEQRIIFENCASP